MSSLPVSFHDTPMDIFPESSAGCTAASQQVQQHPRWVTSNKSKKCALLKCTKNSF